MSKKQKNFILGLILLNALLLRLPAFFQPHLENDEVIFQTLINKTTFKLKDYTLQNTAILPALAGENYDFPSFPHPPGFVYFQTLIIRIFGANFLILLPVLGSLGTIFLVFKISQLLENSRTGLVAAALLSLCPISFFAATKIWIDSFLTFLISLIVYLGLKIKQAKDALLAGLVFSMAVLTKYPAFFILPVVFLMILQKIKSWRQRAKALGFFLLPLVLTLPWFIFQYQTSGVIIRSSIPSSELIEKFPFVRMAVARPFYFYFIQTVVLFPLYFLGLKNLFSIKFLKTNLIFGVWSMSYFFALTFFGFIGGGYQMRYILPAFPALAILTSKSLANINNFCLFLMLLTAVYAVLTGVLNSYVWGTADLVLLFKLAS